MRHAWKLDITRIDRFAGNFFDPIDSQGIGARDLKVLSCLHEVGIEKGISHSEVATVADPKGYLRILGLSFSGKYLSQKGQ
jgi:hypothetical protein